MIESQISPCGNVFDTSDEEGEGDDDLDNTKIHPIYANTISYQKRQALGKNKFDYNIQQITKL